MWGAFGSRIWNARRGCESAPTRDPGQNGSKSLKSSAKTPEVGGPDRRRSGPPLETKPPSIYQGVEVYRRWGPASLLVHNLQYQKPLRTWADQHFNDIVRVKATGGVPRALVRRRIATAALSPRCPGKFQPNPMPAPSATQTTEPRAQVLSSDPYIADLLAVGLHEDQVPVKQGSAADKRGEISKPGQTCTRGHAP